MSIYASCYFILYFCSVVKRVDDHLKLAVSEQVSNSDRAEKIPRCSLSRRPSSLERTERGMARTFAIPPLSADVIHEDTSKASRKRRGRLQHCLLLQHQTPSRRRLLHITSNTCYLCLQIDSISSTRPPFCLLKLLLPRKTSTIRPSSSGAISTRSPEKPRVERKRSTTETKADSYYPSDPCKS